MPSPTAADEDRVPETIRSTGDEACIPHHSRGFFDRPGGTTDRDRDQDDDDGSSADKSRARSRHARGRGVLAPVVECLLILPR